MTSIGLVKIIHRSLTSAIVLVVVLHCGCGDTGLRAVSPSTRRNTFDNFKFSVNQRLLVGLKTSDIVFDRDFDAAVELLEASGPDMLALRKLFYDTVGEVQLAVDEEQRIRERARGGRSLHLRTPDWYSGVPIKLINLIAASALLRKAGYVANDDSSNYAIIVSQAEAVLTTPMKTPHSPYSVTGLLSYARLAVGRTRSDYTEDYRERLVDPARSMPATECHNSALQAVLSLWVLGVVDPRLNVHNHAERINWLVPLITFMGLSTNAVHVSRVSLPKIMKILAQYLFTAEPPVMPTDEKYYTDLFSAIDEFESEFPRLSSGDEESTKMEGILRASPETREFVKLLKFKK
jgi:hypothetical protein